jgi:hypothetical protein
VLERRTHNIEVRSGGGTTGRGPGAGSRIPDGSPPGDRECPSGYVWDPFAAECVEQTPDGSDSGGDSSGGDSTNGDSTGGDSSGGGSSDGGDNSSDQPQTELPLGLTEKQLMYGGIGLIGLTVLTSSRR